MSLTSELKLANSPLGMFMRREFPHLPALSKAIKNSLKDVPTLRQGYDEGYPLMLVGTAIDLRIRHHLSDRPTSNAVIDRGFEKLSRIEFAHFGEDMFFTHHGLNGRKFDRLEDDLRTAWAKFPPRSGLLSSSDEDELCRLCMLFASVEQFGRGAIKPLEYLWPRRSWGLERLVADVDPRIASDLVSLSLAFLETASEVANATSLIVGGSPVGAPHVGGADFDFVADGTLYEVKTTTNPDRITTEALRQLLGYLLLDWDDALQIRRLGLILPRQKTHKAYDVEKLLGGKGLSEMRQKMKDLVSNDECPAPRPV